MHKGLSISNDLALAVSDAAIALKRGWWRSASESAVFQAALLRFLRQTRPDCPYIAAFEKDDSEIARQVRVLAEMTTIPPEVIA